MSFVLTQEAVSRVLSTVDKGLSHGLGQPQPGSMCVEAAVCYALGLPHGDDPECVDEAIRAFKIRLNDSGWSCNRARAKGLRRLAVLQLGTKDNFDRVFFSQQLALKTIKVVLPLALSAIGFDDHAKTCASVTTLLQGRAAARAAANAAANAADAAAYAPNAYAAADAVRAAAAYAVRAAYAATADVVRATTYAAADAARAAARAAADSARDKILSTASKIAEDILIDMKVPAAKFLSMME